MLQGMRLIEGSAFVAAPFAGLSLAQMGADVIRFDLPEGGLDYKRMPRDPESGQSFFWHGLNKGKRSVAIDFRNPEGVALIQALITAPGAGAGLFLTNFAGLPWLDYKLLAAQRTDLIALEITGNYDGSSEVDYSVNPAMGIPAITGKGGMAAPTNAVLPSWDLTCGLQAALSLLAAYTRRCNGGGGQHMTLALSDMAMAIIAHLGMLGEAEKGGIRPPGGNELFGGFGRDFATANGERVMLVCLTLKQWRSFQKASGLENAINTLAEEIGSSLDDEFIRYTHRKAIADLVAPWFAARSLEQIAATFAGSGVCWSRYQTIQQLRREDARLSADNPLWADVNHPGLGVLRTPAGPTMADGRPLQPAASAPRLGQHTEAVLTELLGLPSRAVAKLVDDKVVAL